MTEVRIMAKANSSYVVTGPVKLVDPEGNEFELKGNAITLCRCGASNNKPFCDSSHRRIAFEADTKATARD